MDQPRRLEGDAIPAGDEHRHGDRSRPPREPGDRRAPRRIGDAEGSRAERRDLPRRKGDEEPALRKEGERVAQRARIGRGSTRSARTDPRSTKNGRSSGIRPRRKLARAFTSGRTAESACRRAIPSIAPNGWLATTMTGPVFGTRPRSASPTCTSTSSALQSPREEVVARDPRRPAPVPPGQRRETERVLERARIGAASGDRVRKRDRPCGSSARALVEIRGRGEHERRATRRAPWDRSTRLRAVATTSGTPFRCRDRCGPE